MEYQKLTNLLNTTPDNVPRFTTKVINQVVLRIDTNKTNK